jgi:hypothetical protein
MSLERIIWLIVGIVLIVWAIIVAFSDGLNISQTTHDAVQDGVLGVLALGMAYRAGPPVL